MIKYILVAASVATVGAFGFGALVGWKTTMKAIDIVEKRRAKKERTT